MKLSREIIAYLIVGVLTTIIGLSVYYGLTFTLLDAKNPVQLQIANVVMWIVAVTFAYFANRIFVFKSKGHFIREGIKFYAARVITLLMDMGLMALFVSVFGLNDKVVKLGVQVAVTIGNYIFSKFWVFRREHIS